MWISLVGFNAAGKSSLARRLALLTDRRAIDLDPLVEERAGRSLPEIFTEQGPDSFRELELAALRELPAVAPLVIATGGGTVEQPDSVALLRERSLVIWIDAPWPVLRRRLAPAPGEEASPLWRHLGEETLLALYARRRPLYAAAARVRLETGQLGINALVRRLLGRSSQLRATAPPADAP